VVVRNVPEKIPDPFSPSPLLRGEVDARSNLAETIVLRNMD
jgi:hypothetical protein